jgi:hypothetical protein
LPLGEDLAKSLFKLTYPDEEYDGTSLGDVYGAALASGTPISILRNFLEDHMLCVHIPKAYDELTRIFWHRIYTTNIDDLLFRIYQTSDIKAQILAFPSDDILERDQSLGSIQVVHLHGRLPCDPRDVTFSPQQYARGTAKRQPLYEEFVRDYSYHPVVFVGTQLNEPLFLHYIESRGQRAAGITEHRPKSFLISPHISAPKRTILSQYNITPIEASMEDFLRWIERIASSLPTKVAMLRRTSPLLAQLIEEHSVSTSDEGITAFARSFMRVPAARRVQSRRSLYLLGAAPQWEDIFSNLDAPRETTSKLFSHIEHVHDSDLGLHFVALLGSAGSGKSTILRRLGIRLAQAGRMVFLTNSEEIPSPGAIAKAISLFNERAILLFDNSEVALGLLPAVVSGLSSIKHPPIIVVAARTNDFDRLWRKTGDPQEVPEFLIPHLKRKEIIEIIKLLETHGLLGKLRGSSMRERVDAFENKAKKQILVAMKETTLGEGFDKIIEDEFKKIEPQECQILYLCTAIATDAGYRISKGEFLGCARVPSALALHLLSRNLRDVVIPMGPHNELLLLRHRLIAQHILEGDISRGLLREAYIRLLTTLATAIRPRGKDRSSRLYKAVINHKAIYLRFRSDINEARAIFDALKETLGRDSHFWLQYGSLELEGIGGELVYAENYLTQAESLDPHDPFIKNTIAHLLIKKGATASTFAEASILREKGSTILRQRIEETRFNDDYAVHIYCAQRYTWSRKWHSSNDQLRAQELTHLKEVVEGGLEIRRQHKRLLRLRAAIQRAYLQLGIPSAKRPPALPLKEEDI